MRPAASLIVVVQASAAQSARTAITASKVKGTFRVLMLKRSAHGTFKSMHVFPGGVLSPSDSSLVTTDAHHHYPYTHHAIAAIRETFEECGLGIFNPTINLDSADLEYWRNKVCFVVVVVVIVVVVTSVACSTAVVLYITSIP